MNPKKENQRDFPVEATDAYFLNREAMQEGNPLRALEIMEDFVLRQQEPPD